MGDEGSTLLSFSVCNLRSKDSFPEEAGGVIESKHCGKYPKKPLNCLRSTCSQPATFMCLI